jgi:hypothetical protein
LTSDPAETSNVIQQHGPEAQNFEAHLAKFVSPGAKGVEKVETAMLDQRVMDQLKSLGYLAGPGGRSYELTGTGTDPKDLALPHQMARKCHPPHATPTTRPVETTPSRLSRVGTAKPVHPSS